MPPLPPEWNTIGARGTNPAPPPMMDVNNPSLAKLPPVLDLDSEEEDDQHQDLPIARGTGVPTLHYNLEN